MAGCAVSQKRAVTPAQIRPAQTASKEQLIAAYDEQARAVRSINAAVELMPVAGSTYSGLIEEYHDVSGFILAAQPAKIRIIGQAPVLAKNIFDMTSDGKVFRIFIPSKNKFLVGPTDLERPSEKPIENLRPQHVLEAIFWPPIPAGQPVLFEEAEARAGTLLRADAAAAGRRRPGDCAQDLVRSRRSARFARADFRSRRAV